MFACHTCLDTIQCVTNGSAASQLGLPRVFCDPIWNAIQAEAHVEAVREPLLRPLMDRTVLGRNSIGDGLAMALSQKLGGESIESSTLYDEFRSLAAKHSAIEESARNDLSAIGKNDPATTSLLHPFLNFKGFLALQAYRIAHLIWSSDRRMLAYYLQSRSSEIFGVDIHPAASIGDGVFIDHGTGVVIGETAIVGNNVTILHGVTLGGTGKESGDRHPKVADGVFIGAGAQLLGNIRIGEHARIGASSVVLKDVAGGTTVAGIPAQVVRGQRAPTPGLKILGAATA